MSAYRQLQNPFEDPSVRAAATANSQSELDYNPFDATRSTTQTTKAQPAVSAPLYSSTPNESTSNGASAAAVAPQKVPDDQSSARRITTEELERKQRELDARAAEIERRERELLKESAAVIRQNNWPPFPNWFCVKPCFYQDFEADIAPSYQKTVKTGYALWIGHAVTYLVNVIGGFCYFFGSDMSAQSGTTLGLCILFAILFIPASLLCWYRPLYKAFRDDSSVSFFIFFIIMFAQFATCVIWAIGIPGWGAVGFISGLATLNRNVGCGIIMLLCAALWSALAACDFYLLVRVHRLYRTTGASFERARQELTRGATEQTGRTFAQGVVQSAFGTFGQQPSAQNNGGLPR